MQDHLREEELSAYRDGELSPAERTRAERHLAACEQCRRVLREFAVLASALSEPDQLVPAHLGSALRARLHAPRQSSLRGLRLTMGAVAAALTLAILGLLLGLPGGSAQLANVASAYPAPLATSVSTDTVIEIAYSANVDRQAVEDAVRLEPPVKVSKHWRGDTLLITPAEPLRPDVKYEVMAPASAPAAPVLPIPNPNQAPFPTAAVVTSFHTAPSTMVAAASTTPGPEVAALAATTTVTTFPAGTPEATSTADLVLAALPPLRQTIAASAPGLRLAVGPPTADEVALNLVHQPFAGGEMLWRSDSQLIYVLDADGTWTQFPDTSDSPTGTPAATLAPQRSFGKVWQDHKDVQFSLVEPLAPERALTGFVQLHEGGTVIWTDEGKAYVIHERGTWETVYGGLAGPTALATVTPTVASTATPAASPTRSASPTAATPNPASQLTATPTVRATATVTPTKSPIACEVIPVGGFGDLYTGSQTVSDRLGCATAPERALTVAEQQFEGGTMLWRGGEKAVYVLSAGKMWSAYPDTYVDGETLSAVKPPAELFAPVKSLGKVWREQDGVRTALGWAVEKERGFSSAWQGFEGGQMLLSDRGEILVLFEDGTWESYEDGATG